jgi:elongation factor 2
MGESQQVDPTNGTVAFGSALFGWAFTLTRFARVYADKFKIDTLKLMKKFWGDNFFNPAKKQFTTDGDDGNGGQLPRCFVQFIMKPIVTLIRNIMDGQLDLVWKMLETL